MVLAAVKTDEPVVVVGNGLQVYPDVQAVLQAIFSGAECRPLSVPSAESIGLVGYQKWLLGQTVNKLEPLYLKSLIYNVQGKPAK